MSKRLMAFGVFLSKTHFSLKKKKSASFQVQIGTCNYIYIQPHAKWMETRV